MTPENEEGAHQTPIPTPNSLSPASLAPAADGREGGTTKVASEPFVMVPLRVLRNGLSREDKALYFELLSYAWQSGACWPKQETLANDLNCSTRAIRRGLERLEEAGYIQREWQGTPAKRVYVLTTGTTAVSTLKLNSRLDASDLPRSAISVLQEVDAIEQVDTAGGAYAEATPATPAPPAPPSVRTSPRAETRSGEGVGEGALVYPPGIASNNNGLNALPPSSLEPLAVSDEAGVRAVEIVTRLGSDVTDGQFVALVHRALAESESGVEACLAKIEQAQAAGRVSHASGLLIRMLGDGDHLRLNGHNGIAAGECCLFCGKPQAKDFSRFNGGQPMFLCDHDAEHVNPGGELRSYAELAAEDPAPR